jgi:restriction system protein
MTLDEFSKNMSRIQRIAFPSYISELQKTMSFMDSHFRPMKSISSHIQKQNELINPSLRPYLSISTELQKYYQPIKQALPPYFQSGLAKDLQVINRISEILESSITDLFVFQYDIQEFAKEEHEEEKLIELVDDTKTLLKNIYAQNSLIDVVDPREFEKIVAELLQYKGYDVHLTKRTKDGGYDIIALTKVGGIPFKLLAECKRHKKTIGIDIIRSFCDVISREKANKGLIFTTSYFSPSAITRRNEMGALLELKNRDELIEWIIQYNEE